MVNLLREYIRELLTEDLAKRQAIALELTNNVDWPKSTAERIAFRDDVRANGPNFDAVRRKIIPGLNCIFAITHRLCGKNNSGQRCRNCNNSCTCDRKAQCMCRNGFYCFSHRSSCVCVLSCDCSSWASVLTIIKQTISAPMASDTAAAVI